MRFALGFFHIPFYHVAYFDLQRNLAALDYFPLETIVRIKVTQLY